MYAFFLAHLIDLPSATIFAKQPCEEDCDIGLVLDACGDEFGLVLDACEAECSGLVLDACEKEQSIGYFLDGWG